VIGCGGIARSGHLPAYQAAARDGLCEIVGVCDVDLARAQALAQAYAVPAFATPADLLVQTQPELVSVATHPGSHRDLALQALAAGCHVLCEKPVALHLGEAQEMVEAAERAGLLFSVCFQYRYWDEAVYLRKRIATGDFGHIHSLRTWGGMPRSFPASLGGHRRSVAGRGVLAHWTIHNLDLALWLLGNPEPITASAYCYQRLQHLQADAHVSQDGMIDIHAVDPEIEDFAVGLVRLLGDAVVTVEANYLQPPSLRPEGWELLGVHGAAALSPIRVLLDNGSDWVDDTPPPGALAPCDWSQDRLIADFLRQVRAGGQAPVSGPEILRIQRLMDALYESAACGREVALAD
jgi:predicted dehydrogenase